MNNSSVVYQRELLVPSKTVNLFFKVSEEVQVKDLVGAIRCFDKDESNITDLKSVSYSRKYSRPYVYLRSPKGTAGDWITTSISATQPIKRVEVEIIPWTDRSKDEIENVVLGVWAAATIDTGDYGSSVNFVTSRGTK